MIEPVKTKRRYSSTLRKDQAQQTRKAILEAAHRLFADQGWAPTTIAAIACEAGVSPETIYSVFGNKRTLLERLIQNAVRGDAPAVPLLEQAATRQLADIRDQRQQVRFFAQSICTILDRVAPLVAVARAAAESEPKLRELYRSLHEGRRRNLIFAAEAFSSTGRLRDGMGVQDAADHIFRLASPELFLLMRDVEGRSLENISAWLEAALVNLLLPPP